MGKSPVDGIARTERAAPSPAMIKFNNFGADILTDDEVRVIGDSISQKLIELGEPGLSESASIDNDMSHAEAVDQLASVTTLFVKTKGGKEKMVELRGDSGIGKSGAPTDLRTWVAYKLGLEVISGNPDSVREFVSLATRYVVAKGLAN